MHTPSETLVLSVDRLAISVDVFLAAVWILPPEGENIALLFAENYAIKAIGEGEISSTQWEKERQSASAVSSRSSTRNKKEKQLEKGEEYVEKAV